MPLVEVYADVACPFTHTSLRRFRAHRQERGRPDVGLRVRPWPLQWVNGRPLSPRAVAAEVTALRFSVAPDLFAGFDADHFPASSIPALASEAAAYRAGADVGERFSYAVRTALFEEGADIGDATVLAGVRERNGVPEPGPADEEAVAAGYAEGRRRGVRGSPHFFTAAGGFFCPSLDIAHRPDDGYDVAFDAEGFERFIAAAFG